jgi:aspartate aminotransferase-like enzyme
LAFAQQEKKIFRIGFLGQGKAFLYRARIKALQQGLRELSSMPARAVIQALLTESAGTKVVA